MRKIPILKIVIVIFSGLVLFSYLKMNIGKIGSVELDESIFDDSYMFLRYAKNWLNGNGFSWNATDGPSYGITSTLYLFIITILRGVTNLSDVVILTGTSFVFGLFACFTLVFLGFLIQGKQISQDSWIPILVIPVLLFLPPFKAHSVTGMETTLSLWMNSLLACSVVVFSRRCSNLTLILCLLFGYMSFLTRPDNGLYALLLPPIFLLATNRSLWNYVIKYIVIFLIILLLDMMMKKVLFGSILPLPFFAKSSGFYRGFLGTPNSIFAMMPFCDAVVPIILVVVASITSFSYKQVLAILIPVFATFSYLVTVNQIMGSFSRFYYPSLSFFIFAAFISITALNTKKTENSTDFSFHKIGWRIIIALIFLLPSISISFRNIATNFWQNNMMKSFSHTPILNIEYKKISTKQLPVLGQKSILEISKLLQKLPKEITLAASEYGYLSSKFPFMTIIDMVGLHDKNIIQKGFSAEYLFSRNPDIIWFPYRTYSHDIAEILNSKTFALEYEYYPNVYDYGIALRKNSRFFLIIKKVLEESLRIYSEENLSNFLAQPVEKQ